MTKRTASVMDPGCRVRAAFPSAHRSGVLALVTALLLLVGCDDAGQTSQTETADGGPGTTSPAMDEPVDRDVDAPVGALLHHDDMARIAWRYFENNVQPETGLVNAVDGYPSATMWDTGAALLAMISAERLNLIRTSDFEQRVGKMLSALADIRFFADMLPNKVYHTETLQMVNYANLPTPEGIGWSAIDIARLMVPLVIIERDYPSLADNARRVKERLDLDHMLSKGQLFGGRPLPDGEPERVQEGRLGYEEYAAAALLRSGWDARTARRVDDTIGFREILGIDIATDTRNRQSFGANVVTTSEPYFLFGLEFGLDDDIEAIARNLVAVQHERWRRTGIMTALTEGHLDHAPYFVYNGIVANDVEWASISPAGDRLPDVRTLSVKAAFSWHMLFDTPYTRRLAVRIKDAADEEKGWYQGFYEVDGRTNKVLTVNTNAVILEALHYERFGPLLPPENAD